MKKMGGYNPFGAPAPPVRRPSVQTQEQAEVEQENAAPLEIPESIVAKSQSEEIEQVEDEAARRRRIAEKMSKMGGFNPFGAPAPRKADPVLPSESTHDHEESVDERPIDRSTRQSVPMKPVRAPPVPKGSHLANVEVSEEHPADQSARPSQPLMPSRAPPVPKLPPLAYDEEDESVLPKDHFETKRDEELPPSIPSRPNRAAPIPEPVEEETSFIDGASDEEVQVEGETSFIEELSEDEEEKDEEEAPPVPSRATRPAPLAPLEREDEQPTVDEAPPVVPIQSGRERPSIPPPPPLALEREVERATIDEAPPVPDRSARDRRSFQIPPPPPLNAAAEEEKEAEDSREGASTPIPRRTSFMDFSEEAEEEEEAPPPPPPRRPPVPAVPAVNRAQPEAAPSQPQHTRCKFIRHRATALLNLLRSSSRTKAVDHEFVRSSSIVYKLRRRAKCAV